MNYQRLENNIVDLIEVQQLNLGYLKETVRLYYPLSSLNNFLKTGCDVDEIIFNSHSNSVHIEEMSNGEFDYLIYFEDGNPDNYRYCVSVEGEHVTYHRYTPEDYEDFGF